MSVGRKLRELRKTYHYTLKDVKERTGLSISFLSDVERGQTKPSLDSLKKLAVCYQVGTSDLLEDAETVASTPVYPPGFVEFSENVSMNEDMKEVLLTVERYSRKRAEVKEDWMQYYYTLKQIMGR